MYPEKFKFTFTKLRPNILHIAIELIWDEELDVKSNIDIFTQKIKLTND